MTTTTADDYKKLWIRYAWSDTLEDGTVVPRVSYDSIGGLLGYPVIADTTNGSLQVTDYGSNGTLGQHSELFSLLQDIVSTRVLLSQALRDSMAKEIGELKLDMGTYITNLRLQGSAKLAMLAKYTGIPLEVDFFTGRVYDNRTTPFCVKSLF